MWQTQFQTTQQVSEGFSKTEGFHFGALCNLQDCVRAGPPLTVPARSSGSMFQQRERESLKLSYCSLSTRTSIVPKVAFKHGLSQIHCSASCKAKQHRTRNRAHKYLRNYLSQQWNGWWHTIGEDLHWYIYINIYKYKIYIYIYCVIGLLLPKHWVFLEKALNRPL